MFEALTAAGVRDLVRQLEIRLPGYGPARFDMAIPDLRWALEIDVHPSTGPGGDGPGQPARRRGRYVGWFVRRVSEVQLVDHFAHTVDAVLASIERRRQHVDGER